MNEDEVPSWHKENLILFTDKIVSYRVWPTSIFLTISQKIVHYSPLCGQWKCVYFRNWSTIRLISFNNFHAVAFNLVSVHSAKFPLVIFCPVLTSYQIYFVSKFISPLNETELAHILLNNTLLISVSWLMWTSRCIFWMWMSVLPFTIHGHIRS